MYHVICELKMKKKKRRCKGWWHDIINFHHNLLEVARWRRVVQGFGVKGEKHGRCFQSWPLIETCVDRVDQCGPLDVATLGRSCVKLWEFEERSFPHWGTRAWSSFFTRMELFTLVHLIWRSCFIGVDVAPLHSLCGLDMMSNVPTNVGLVLPLFHKHY